MTTSDLRLKEPADRAIEAGVSGVRYAIHDVPIHVVQAAIIAAENAPDMRTDVVELAMVHLDAGQPDSRDVAQAMISSIVADCDR